MHAGSRRSAPCRGSPTATSRSYATWSVLAGSLWLTTSVAALAVIIATSRDWVQAADRADRLAVPLLVGFAVQVLIGALSYLIPVVLGGGPSVVRATTEMLDKGGAVRVVFVNLGLLAWSFALCRRRTPGTRCASGSAAVGPASPVQDHGVVGQGAAGVLEHAVGLGEVWLTCTPALGVGLQPLGQLRFLVAGPADEA
jgi:hypothetical protein